MLAFRLPFVLTLTVVALILAVGWQQLVIAYGLLALCVGTCFGGASLNGIVFAAEVGSPTGAPHRITSPSASAHSVARSGAPLERSDCFGGLGASNVARQALRVEQITPEAFAGISRSEAGPVGNPFMPSPLAYGKAVSPKTEPVSTVSTQAMYGKVEKASDESEPEIKEGNVISRAVKSVRRIWR